MWAERAWTEVIIMLCDGVLTRTIPWAMSVTECVILEIFLQFLKLVVDQPALCCAKNIKTRSTLQRIILYFIRLAQTSSYLLLWGNLN